MKQIDIGQISMSFDGTRLTITRKDQPHMSISFDIGGVEEIVDFVTSLAGKQFNKRATFRVPLEDDSGLRVKLSQGDKTISAKPTNVSLTGLFIAPPRIAALDLAKEAKLEAVLEFEGITSTHAAVVKRQIEAGYGLFFPDTMDGQEIDAPQELSQIVMELQRRWMRRKAEQG